MNGKGSKDRTKDARAFRKNFDLIFEPKHPEWKDKDRRETYYAHQRRLGLCVHQQRCRYTNGFWCQDCDGFFSKESPEYRSSELLSTLWMTLWNINSERSRANKPRHKDVEAMRDKIGIGIWHDDYEKIIKDARAVIRKYGSNEKSVTLTLK